MKQKKILQMFPNMRFENEDQSDACAIGAAYFLTRRNIDNDETYL